MEDDTLTQIFKMKLMSPPCQNQGYILDGYPKTFDQAQSLFGGKFKFFIFTIIFFDFFQLLVKKVKKYLENFIFIFINLEEESGEDRKQPTNERIMPGLLLIFLFIKI